MRVRPQSGSTRAAAALGGVGLGLTIVDRILHAVGGTLRFDEAELGGARATMTWPCHA